MKHSHMSFGQTANMADVHLPGERGKNNFESPCIASVLFKNFCKMKHPTATQAQHSRRRRAIGNYLAR